AILEFSENNQFNDDYQAKPAVSCDIDSALLIQGMNMDANVHEANFVGKISCKAGEE
ncbi:unnamed protein product, partial [Allacma fusca]